MACGLSFLELYGATLLNERILPNTMSKRDLAFNLSNLGLQLQITDGMDGSSAENEQSEEGKPRAYQSQGVPLHRSKAVRVALSRMAAEEIKTDYQVEHAVAGTSKACGFERPKSREQPAGACRQEKPVLEKQHTDGREQEQSQLQKQPVIAQLKIKLDEPCGKVTAEKRVTSLRPHPYATSFLRRSVPINVTPQSKKLKKIRHNPSWPTEMMGLHVVPEIEQINKSFSTPVLRAGSNSPSIQEPTSMLGDKIHAFAIQSLSRACADPDITQVTLLSGSSPPKTTIPPSFRGDDNVPSHPNQQKDNFRRLMSLQADRFSSSLSSRDIDLQRLISDSLAANGVCVIDGFLGGSLAGRIRDEVLQLHSKSGVVKGELVGKGRDGTATRGDVITWVEGTEPQCKNIGLLCQKMDKIVSVGMGVAPDYDICGGTKVMVARYPGGGARYKMHVDNLAKDGRCLTCIYYLNEKWDPNVSGGLLRIHAQTRGQTANIAPLLDRMAIFYSDGRNPHEVLPCYADRYAITLWYFDREERSKALGRMDLKSQSTSKESAATNC